MPTVSIRVSDELKSRLDTLAQESESTLSGVIVEALNSITGLGREDYPEETVPYTINNANRLILHNTELLLAHCQDLDEDERKSHAKNEGQTLQARQPPHRPDGSNPVLPERALHERVHHGAAIYGAI